MKVKWVTKKTEIILKSRKDIEEKNIEEKNRKQ